jgi:inorganic pyrophosphatase
MRARLVIAWGLVACMLGASLAVAADSLRQPKQAPAEIDALIEIPAGTSAKYELDPASGRLRLDRFQSMPVVYPVNYGFVPASLAGDDDPLDVVVYTREPVYPGVLIRVRPIGVLQMTDGGERDDKIVAVPTDAVDPTYAALRDIGDLPPIERDRLVAFFLTYKQLPAGRKQVDLLSIAGAADARALITEAMQREAAQRR